MSGFKFTLNWTSVKLESNQSISQVHLLHREDSPPTRYSLALSVATQRTTVWWVKAPCVRSWLGCRCFTHTHVAGKLESIKEGKEQHENRSRVLPLPRHPFSTWGSVLPGSASACWALGTSPGSFPQGRGGRTRSHSSLYGTWSLFHRRPSTARSWQEKRSYGEIWTVLKLYTLLTSGMFFLCFCFLKTNGIYWLWEWT